MTERISDEELAEMEAHNNLLHGKDDEKLTKAQLHRRRLLAEVKFLRAQIPEQSNKEA